MRFYDDTQSVSEPSFWVANELDVPLIPGALIDQHEKFQPTHLGTLREPNPESDYMFRPSLRFLTKQPPDHYVLSFWGHGANSYSSNFRLAYGNVAVLFQIGFGAYQDPISSRTAWNESVAGIDAFLSDIIITPFREPRIRDTIVAFSNFRDFEASGSEPTLYSRGTDNHWAHEVTYPSWGEFQREHSSN